LDASDRLVFRQRFEALVAQIERFTPTEGDEHALPQALAKARAALGLQPPPPPAPEPISPLKIAEPLPPTPTQAPPKPPLMERRNQGWRIAVLAAMALFLFAVGLGASRLLTAFRTAPLLAAHTGAIAVLATPTAAHVAPGYGLSEAQLETLPW